MTPHREDPIELTLQTWERRGLDDAWFLAAAGSISRVAEIIRLAVEGVTKPYGVNQTRVEILNLLFVSRAGELPMGKIGSRLFMQPTSITSAVDGLERMGYVERVAHPLDRRTTLARITPSGRDLVLATAPAIARTRYGLGTLSEDELKDVVRLLRGARLANGDFDEAALDGTDAPE